MAGRASQRHCGALLVEGASIRDTPGLFPQRRCSSACKLCCEFSYFDEAIEILFNRYLLKTTTRELEFETAEANYRKGHAFNANEDWNAAELGV